MPLLVLAGSFSPPAATRLGRERERSFNDLPPYKLSRCYHLSARRGNGGKRSRDRMIRRERKMKRKRQARRGSSEEGERRRCEGRLGRHLPTARSVTETAVGDALDAAPQSLLPPRFAAPPRFSSAALVSDAIRTLRILNSKLQNMLSGRYKSKVGPARVRGSPRGERDRDFYPSTPSPGFHGARGKGPPHPP